MTDIGAKLLSLLTSSLDDWEYRPACDGLTHKPTGIIVAPSIEGHVVVIADTVSCTGALSREDHAALSAVVAPMTDARKKAAERRPREILCELLGLKANE